MRQRTNNRAGGLLISLRRFIRQTKGAVAIEFAMIFPIMITIYFGVVEMSQGLAASRKVTMLTSTVGDIVAQFGATGITTADLVGIYDAADEIMRPFPTDGLGQLRINVYSVTTVAANNWSYSPDGECVGGQPTVPANLLASGGSVIIAHVCYVHNSVLHRFFTSDPTFTDTFYMRPRGVSFIVGP
ncbi:MAG: pilus assembly protein [Rhizobiales bacterium]|nr:pilus assembly protein [Hyphomicrobiales bacterium]